ncbi:MAG: hypothetical protein ACOC32_04815, partial [Nanoarchaeota archaeon]
LENIIIPELIEERAQRYQKKGLSKDIADAAARFDFASVSVHADFDAVMDAFAKLDPQFIAQSIINAPKEAKKRFSIEFSDDHYKEVFTLLEKVQDGEITKDAFMELLPRMIKKEKIDFTAYKPMDEAAVEARIKEIVKKNKDAPFGALMGMCMKEFRGKVDGKTISELVRKHAQ